MFKSSYKIATVWGIPIKANISMLFLIGYLAISLPLPMLLGLAAGLVLFLSITLHELGHSYVAIRKGCRVREINLAIFGGVASMESIPSKPKDELQMAIAGPIVSLALCITGLSSGYLLFMTNSYVTQQLGKLLLITGLWNLMLFGFNILPAFPMDGGRVLRALLTPKFGKVKATYIASRIGKGLALIFGFWGLSLFLHGEEFGIFRVIIAALIYTGAENEYKLVKMQEAAKWSSPQDQPPPFSEPFSTNDAILEDNEVEISPAPYDKGPVSRSQVHNATDVNPFTKPFER